MTIARPSLEPGSLAHVFNRGTGRRSIFEDVRDIEYVHEKLLREVEADHVRIRAFAEMTNHWHWLVEVRNSPIGDVVRRVFAPHARRFNDARGRTGALFGSRFRLVAIRDEWHANTALSYVDQNPKAAGIVPDASLYPYCTAFGHRRGVLPEFVDRESLSQILGVPYGDRERWARAYRERFGPELDPELRHLFETRERVLLGSKKSFEDLLGASSVHFREWLRRRGEASDARGRILPFCTPRRILRACRDLAEIHPDFAVQMSGRRVDPWPWIRVGLLLETCGVDAAALTRSEGVSLATIQNRRRKYRDCLRREDFGHRVRQVLENACLWPAR